MMTTTTAYEIRGLIHAADIAAITERKALIQDGAKTVENLTRLQEIERERAFASNATNVLWIAKDSEPEYSDPAIKLWRACHRAAKISPIAYMRWLPVLIALEKIWRGHGNLLTLSAP